MAAKQLASDIKMGLEAPLRLKREAALSRLAKQLNNDSASEEGGAFRDAMCCEVLQLLADSQWQPRLGGLDAAQVLVPVADGTADFLDSVLAHCQRLLEDDEPRVRAAVAECIGAIAARCGAAVFDVMGPQIIGSIQASFARDPPQTKEEAAARGGGAPCATGIAAAVAATAASANITTVPPQGVSGDNATRAGFTQRLLEAGYAEQRVGAGEMRHDTEGWRCLESSFHALQTLMEGCGTAGLPYMTSGMRMLILDSLRHQNRFVRERGHRVVQALLGVLSDSPLLTSIVDSLVPALADGLNDSWPQVRFAASEASRALLMAIKQRGELDVVLPQLLPAMLFNRHSVAEGLRRYSQTTWEMTMGTTGRDQVAHFLPEVVKFYTRQARANNHEFREAACECFSELAQKIDRGAVQPLVPAMLAAILGCFRDSSWPVREAACEACGQFAAAYPEETHLLLPRLWGLWFDHATENVPSVRETAAVALGNAVRAYGQEALDIVLPRARDMLERVKQQPADDDRYVKTSYGVAARRVDEAPPADDEDAALFGGPSLQPVTYTSAPAPSRAGGSGPGSGTGSKLFSISALSKEPNDCCMDAGFIRTREAWEAADGAAYLVRELASAAPDAALPPLMPLLAAAAAADHYAHACHLQETVWKQLPLIALQLGNKRTFKRYLEPFLDPLFRSVQSAAHHNSQAAAIRCAAFLRDWLGPRIFAGRLSLPQQQIMQQFVPTSIVYTNKACFVADAVKPKGLQ